MITIKKLTKSDLTIISRFWDKKLKQLAICLKKNYIETLGSDFSTMEVGESIKFDMTYYGPSNADALIRTGASIGRQQKDWRLQSASIKGDDDSESRFGILDREGTYFIFSLSTLDENKTGVGLLLSQNDETDKLIIQKIHSYGNKPISSNILIELIDDVGLPTNHAIYKVIANLEENDNNEIQVGDISIEGNSRKVSKEELQKQIEAASKIGEQGENLLDSWLGGFPVIFGKKVVNHKWVSNVSATSPYDFSITFEDNQILFVELKSTTQNFNSKFYISQGELKKMVSSNVAIFRLFEMTENKAKLRICVHTNDRSHEVLETFKLKSGLVKATQFSVETGFYDFEEQVIEVCQS